jgi:hypothetical protein
VFLPFEAWKLCKLYFKIQFLVRESIVSALQGSVRVSAHYYVSHESDENIIYVMFNVGALTVSRRMDWMSANPIH